MPVGRRSSVCTSHSCSSLRRTVSPAPPSNSTLSGTTTAARPLIFEQRLDVLDEVELLVAGRGPEVVAHDGQVLALLLALLVDDQDARLLAERRIGQHDVEARRRGRRARLSPLSTGGSASPSSGRCRAGAGSWRTGGRRCRRARRRAAPRACRCRFWSRVEVRVVVDDVVVGGEQEAAGAAGRVADRLARRGPHARRRSPGSAARGVKYWPAPPSCPAAFFSSSPS